MPRVLISTEVLRHQAGRHVEILREAGFEVVFPNNPEFGRGRCGLEESIAELSGIDALQAGSEFVTAEMLQALPQLRVIARTGVGYDRIDVDAATTQGVVLTITPTANHDAVAEHALALLFALSKRVVIGDAATRRGEWPRELTEPVRGKTLGIVGLGRTGRSMALRAQALGMTVVAYDPFPDTTFATEQQIPLLTLAELAARCDVMSLHCPVTPETHGLINAAVFSQMKNTAFLINTARGAIVAEEDLVQALSSGQIAGAGLDVFAEEPPTADNPLFSLTNVVLTPHLAGGERLAMRDMAIESAQCIATLYQGGWPEGAVVNQILAKDWSW